MDKTFQAILAVESKTKLGRLDLTDRQRLELGIDIGKAIANGDDIYAVIDQHTVLGSSPGNEYDATAARPRR